VRVVVDGAGASVETRDYYPFGLRMPGRSTTEGTPAKEDYTGHELDAQTQLHYAGARYYLSAYGRWTTTDPILMEQGPNKLLKDGKVQAFSMSAYNYSFNNPINLRDASGKWPTPWDIADFGFVAQSIYAAWSDPSASNIGWAAFDVVAAAAPVVPSSGYFRGGAKLLSEGGEAARALLPRMSSKSRELISELAEQGVKHSPGDILRIGRNSAGKTVFLETGSSKAGLQHILERHGDQFADRGIDASQVGDAVFKAVTEGKVVGRQGRGRPIYEVKIDDEVHRIAVTVADNGFIVGANPAK
jgi:RHS repeat-associated protein